MRYLFKNKLITVKNWLLIYSLNYKAADVCYLGQLKEKRVYYSIKVVGMIEKALLKKKGVNLYSYSSFTVFIYVLK